MKVLFIIAAFNEEASINRVVTELTDAGQSVLVVNDGSTDKTAEILAKIGPPLYVATHPTNLGQGASLQTGLVCARLLNPDFVITFDADGQHSLTDALAMITFMEKSPSLQILLGSRFLGSTINMPWIRWLMLKIAIFYTRISSGLRITDTHNGLRVLRRSFYQKFNFTSPGMEHASEILDCIGLLKVSYAEFPVTITYNSYSLAKGQRSSQALSLFFRLIEEKL